MPDIAMPIVPKRHLSIATGILIHIALAGCSNGDDNIDINIDSVVVPTARQLCDEAVFASAAPVADTAIQEISGIVESRAQPGVFWVHPDSGHAAEIFAVNAQGQTLNRYRLHGVSNIDWEDIAIAADDNGIARLYIGDIGDNAKARDHITVYALVEPAITGDGTTIAVSDVTAHHYTYPDAAHNAESLFVDERDDRLYLVTKETDVISQTN